MVVALDASALCRVTCVVFGAAVDEVLAAHGIVVRTAAIAVVCELATRLVVIALGPVWALVVRGFNFHRVDRRMR